jgi:hypothetical protein
MTAELDIYRAANILVQEYGPEQAPLMAAKRCDVLHWRAASVEGGAASGAGVDED